MIRRQSLRRLARERLRDAEALLAHGRYGAAFYMGGYVVELALKARICRTLGWPEFPEKRAEFQALTTFRTHDLGVLLHLSGRESIVKARYLAAWNVVSKWDAESRYRLCGRASKPDAASLVSSARALMAAI